MLSSFALYSLGFVGMWLGAGMALAPITKLAKALSFSAFNLSFIVLGIMTSIGEFSVGVNAILVNDPEIYVGNLLGASLILILFVVPILALMGNRLTIDKELRGSNLPIVLGVVMLPSILSLDGQITPTDAGIAVSSYLILIAIMRAKSSFIDKLKIHRPTHFAFKDLLLVALGVVIIFVSSKLVVTETLHFAQVYNLSPFMLSLIVISLGTNLPEIVIGLRALLQHKSNLAFADYLGSASFNTFLFGAFSLSSATTIRLTNSYWIPMLTTMLGLTLFYLFAKSKDTISRRESVALLLIYIGFLTIEVIR